MAVTAPVLNTIGLVVTISGCALLYRFGLPADVDPQGRIFIATKNRDEAEIDKGRLYRRLGRLGISLVAVGSAIQIGATWIG